MNGTAWNIRRLRRNPTSKASPDHDLYPTDWKIRGHVLEYYLGLADETNVSLISYGSLQF